MVGARLYGAAVPVRAWGWVAAAWRATIRAAAVRVVVIGAIAVVIVGLVGRVVVANAPKRAGVRLVPGAISGSGVCYSVAEGFARVVVVAWVMIAASPVFAVRGD